MYVMLLGNDDVYVTVVMRLGSPQNVTVVWQWFENIHGRWCTYSTEITQLIEKAYQNGEQSVRFVTCVIRVHCSMTCCGKHGGDDGVGDVVGMMVWETWWG